MRYASAHVRSLFVDARLFMCWQCMQYSAEPWWVFIEVLRRVPQDWDPLDYFSPDFWDFCSWEPGGHRYVTLEYLMEADDSWDC